jgi:ATP-dependent helicase/nuclease subunit A
VVHACLDMLAARIDKGDGAAMLLAELPAWSQRISALLRADGLPRPVVDRLTRDALIALNKVLRDPVGLWLLAPRARAHSEFSITSVPEKEQQRTDATVRPATIRVDRIFEAGSEPSIEGEDFLWIIDYKTTALSAVDLHGFLNAQRVIYGPQLETYARILGPARGKSLHQIRLALYFPGVPQLTWWSLEGDN